MAKIAQIYDSKILYVVSGSDNVAMHECCCGSTTTTTTTTTTTVSTTTGTTTTTVPPPPVTHECCEGTVYSWSGGLQVYRLPYPCSVCTVEGWNVDCATGGPGICEPGSETICVFSDSYCLAGWCVLELLSNNCVYI